MQMGERERERDMGRERERERLFIDGLISRIVYIASLRLGGRKPPTYELMLRLLGVATMYGWISRCRNGKVVQ